MIVRMKVPGFDRWTLDTRQYELLRTGRPARDALKAKAERVAAAAGPGFIVVEGESRRRSRFIVRPATPEARRANRETYAVLRALPAGGAP